MNIFRRAALLIACAGVSPIAAFADQQTYLLDKKLSSIKTVTENAFLEASAKLPLRSGKIEVDTVSGKISLIEVNFSTDPFALSVEPPEQQPLLDALLAEVPTVLVKATSDRISCKSKNSCNGHFRVQGGKDSGETTLPLSISMSPSTVEIRSTKELSAKEINLPLSSAKATAVLVFVKTTN